VLSNVFASLEAYFAKAKYKEFAASVSATTTPPTMGTGGSAAGRYAIHGSTVHFYAQVVFGTGMTPGAGYYNIALPVPAKQPWDYSRVGLVTGYDASAAEHAIGFGYINPSDASSVNVFSGNVTWTDALPWVWAAGDSFDVHLVYERG